MIGKTRHCSAVWHYFWLTTLLLSIAVVLSACTRDKKGASPKQTTGTTEAAEVSLPALAPDSGSLPQIDADRAFRYTKEVIAFGPRPIGSANHKKLEHYIYAHLKGDQIQDDLFTADTPEGKLPVRNIVAQYPGTKDGIVVIAGHYDTPYNLRNIPFVGANDGGSSTAILLEFADELRAKKRDGYSVWLLFTDGEESVSGHWSDADSLYGTKQLADVWQKDGTLKKIKAFLLADMIADRDLNIERETHSTPWLEELVYQAATRYGYQSHFFARTLDIQDDHLPFIRKGVPAVDIIDLDYGYNNSFHHSTEDTIDKLSPKSMQIVGDVILETVRLLDHSPNLPPTAATPKESR